MDLDHRWRGAAGTPGPPVLKRRSVLPPEAIISDIPGRGVYVILILYRPGNTYGQGNTGRTGPVSSLPRGVRTHPPASDGSSAASRQGPAPTDTKRFILPGMALSLCHLRPNVAVVA